MNYSALLECIWLARLGMMASEVCPVTCSTPIQTMHSCRSSGISVGCLPPSFLRGSGGVRGLALWGKHQPVCCGYTSPCAENSQMILSAVGSCPETPGLP